MCSWVDSRTPTNYAEIFVKSIYVGTRRVFECACRREGERKYIK